MKRIIDIPSNMLSTCQWHKDGICEINELERDILIEEVMDGKDLIEFLTQIKIEMSDVPAMFYGHDNSIHCINGADVKHNMIEVIDKHLSELRGGLNDRNGSKSNSHG